MPIVALIPLVVMPFAYRLEGDRPGIRAIAGAVIAVAAAAVLATMRN